MAHTWKAGPSKTGTEGALSHGEMTRPFPPWGPLGTQKAVGTNAQCFNFFSSAKDRAVRHRRNPYLEDPQQAMAITILLLRVPAWALQTRAACSDRALSRGEESAVTGGALWALGGAGTGWRGSGSAPGSLQGSWLAERKRGSAR